MQRTPNRSANRPSLIRLLIVLAAMAFVPGCSDPLTLYHVPGSEAYLARGSKILVLPFMDTRTYVSTADKRNGDVGEYTRGIFVEALHEYNAHRVVQILTPKMPRRTRSLTNAQVAELGRQYDADVVIAGQVFSFEATRAGSIPPRAGMFVRVINARDGSLLFVGDHYRAAAVPGANGGRDLQALYVSARLIEGFVSKIQPSLMAAGEIASAGAFAMLSPQPVKKGLLSRLFRSGDKREPVMAKRKLFAWTGTQRKGPALGNLFSGELDGGVANRNKGDKAGPEKRKKKKEPGNVPETERLLGMTASFLFSPEQWDEQFVPEVPPLIDFEDNFYQLPAPPPDGSSPEPLPTPPPSFGDEERGKAVETARKIDEKPVAQSASAEAASVDAAGGWGKTVPEQAASKAAASQVVAAGAGVEANSGSDRTPVADSGDKPADSATADFASSWVSSPGASTLRRAGSVGDDVEVDASAAWVIDELPEIDMSRVYPNIVNADAPSPAPATSAKISGDELASDLFAAGGETWQLPPDGPVYSEPVDMRNLAALGLAAAAPYQPYQAYQQTPGQYGFGPAAGQPGANPSDAVIVPYIMTGVETGRGGYGADGQVSFQLNPDTLEIMSILLPPGQLPIAPVAAAPVMSSPGMYPGMTGPFSAVPPMPDTFMTMTSPAAMEGTADLAVPVAQAWGIPSAENAASGYDAAFIVDIQAGERIPQTMVGNIPSPGPERPVSAMASKTSPKAPLKPLASRYGGGVPDVDEPGSGAASGFVPDELGFSSSARSKPKAKRPPNRRGSRSQSVKGTMVQSPRARVLAKEAENAVLDGPLLDGQIASTQPRTLKSIENQLRDDPYLAMQDPTALVFMPRWNAGGIKVLVLPYHERDNPNNLIYNTGGGEVVTTLFGIQLASDLGLSVMWDSTGKATHNRLVSREDAIEMGRMAGADYVIRGQVMEFRRAQSSQFIFADSSGVDVATEMYRVSDGACVMSRRDRSQQKYVVQAEKTVRRLAEDMGANVQFVLQQPWWPVQMAPVIDVQDPAAVLGYSARRRKVRE